MSIAWDESEDARSEEWAEAARIEAADWEWWSDTIERGVDTLAVLWGSGDGNGGGLFDVMRRIVYAFDPLCDPANRAAHSRVYLKKPVSQALRKQVFERDAYRCVKCGSWKDLCADHIYPESKGGPTTLENMQTLCRPCNASKGARVE